MKSLATFDKAIRAKGYHFKKSYPITGATGYIYEKSVEISGRIYIAQIEYDDYGNNIPAIYFCTTSKSQISKITDVMSTKGCGSPEIKNPKEGKIEYHYDCSNYKLVLTENNMLSLDNREITEQTVLIYKN